MSALRVGMKAKSIAAENYGATGTLVEYDTSDNSWLVRWDVAVNVYLGMSSVGVYPAGSDLWTDADFLVPILPPKSQELVSWESMPCNRDGSYRHTEAA